MVIELHRCGAGGSDVDAGEETEDVRSRNAAKASTTPRRVRCHSSRNRRLQLCGVREGNSLLTVILVLAVGIYECDYPASALTREATLAAF